MTRAQALSYWLQRLILPIPFLYFAYGRARTLSQSESWEALGRLIDADPLGARTMMAYEQVTSHVLLLAFHLFVAGLLLVSRPPETPPERLAHVLAPIVGTFANAGFELAAYLPSSMQQPLWAPTPLALLVAGAFMVTGYAISLAALLHLRRSFALFVEVRSLVQSGPYRLCRHPMYLGYLFVVAALLLVRPSLAMVLLCGAVVGIAVYRAHLEDGMLAEHVQGHAEYRARVPFLIPGTKR